jgi:hypothetical protein
MTRPWRARRAAPCLLTTALALFALAGCSNPIGSPSPRATASERAMTACRQRADEVFDRQNRNAVFRSDEYVASQRGAPYASTGLGLSRDPSAGLSDQYARDVILDDCLNSTAERPGATPDSAAESGTAGPPATAPRPPGR